MKVGARRGKIKYRRAAGVSRKILISMLLNSVYYTNIFIFPYFKPTPPRKYFTHPPFSQPNQTIPFILLCQGGFTFSAISHFFCVVVVGIYLGCAGDFLKAIERGSLRDDIGWFEEGEIET